MDQFTYPTNGELREIEPDLVRQLTLTDPLFRHFPIVNANADVLMWECYDRMTGLQAARGLNGDPTHVLPVGAKGYVAQPGVYGEFLPIDEKYLTQARPLGVMAGPIDLTTEIRRNQDFLLGREIDRIKQIGWTLLSTGTFSVLGRDGSVVHTDRFTMQTATASVVWSTVATATPMADFRAVKLLSRGHSISFGAGAVAYMNQATFNEMLSNTNTVDLGGKLTSLLHTGAESAAAMADLPLLNKILLGAGLPTIEIYDEGYIDDTDTFQLFIPNDVVIIVGRRTTGANLGEYRMTRNANNPNFAPGSYVQVVDSLTTGNPVPRRIELHRGHNGGPVIFYPNGIVRLSV